ncbi:MAG: ChaN family lipoprotein, partial [Betaproteobacteria bacterium]|nr:ChaN family lipoprotein [Betaproteobacteria bacterium]
MPRPRPMRGTAAARCARKRCSCMAPSAAPTRSCRALPEEADCRRSHVRRRDSLPRPVHGRQSGVAIGQSRMSRAFAHAALALVLGAAWATGAIGSTSAQCLLPGDWVVPGTGRVAASDVLARAAGARIVLLGERHDSAAHHRWQLDMLEALLARRPGLVVGFEAFPRRVQAALDRWVEGELGEEQFLKAVDWERIWGFDAALYLPLFRFAQRERVRMVALNVSRDTVRAVSQKGLAAVPVGEREGVADPAPATADYLGWLFTIYAGHARPGVTPSREDVAFSRFVEVQLLWDGAMAQALARAVDAAR